MVRRRNDDVIVADAKLLCWRLPAWSLDIPSDGHRDDFIAQTKCYLADTRMGGGQVG